MSGDQKVTVRMRRTRRGAAEVSRLVATSSIKVVTAVTITASLLVVGSDASGHSSIPLSFPEAKGPRPVRSCESLAALTFSDGTKVTGAAEVEDDGNVPAWCRVSLLIPERINVEVGLPLDNYNGRFMGIGGGVFAGAALPPTQAVAAGYAGATTDTGHQGAIVNGEWAWSPTGQNWAQIQDFGYRSVHEMTVKTKIVIEAFYGEPPKYSYWNGCSTGGRQGLMEAQRYPEDYDGILAGAPAINWTRLHVAQLWGQVVMKEKGNFVPQCKFQAATAAAIEVCDGADHLQDGVIDPTRCSFNPKTLVGMETDCGTITKADVAVMKSIWRGPRSSDGSFMWFGLTQGSDFSALNNTVTTPTGQGDGVPFPVTLEWIKWWLEKDPAWDWHTATFEQYEEWFRQSQEEYDYVLATDDPNLTEFRNNGGKIILWHGLADNLIYPEGTLHYFKRLRERMGGRKPTESFARFFFAPGVGHCSGGAGPNPKDPFAAVVDWVENGRAPDRLPATALGGDGETVTRPLCPWPLVARYLGSGSKDKAKSFVCDESYR